MTIRLLGPPVVERDGREHRPAGMKTWALLAYLLLAERPSSRNRLADLCFPEADDPRGALRWALADLRRLLGSDAVLGGDPVRLHVPAGTLVDIQVVISDSALAPSVAALDGELLEGLSFPSSAPLELWLVCERQRLAASCRQILLAEANAAREARDAGALASLTARLVVLDPFVTPAELATHLAETAWSNERHSEQELNGGRARPHRDRTPGARGTRYPGRADLAGVQPAR